MIKITKNLQRTNRRIVVSGLKAGDKILSGGIQYTLRSLYRVNLENYGFDNSADDLEYLENYTINNNLILVYVDDYNGYIDDSSMSNRLKEGGIFFKVKKKGTKEWIKGE